MNAPPTPMPTTFPLNFESTIMTTTSTPAISTPASGGINVPPSNGAPAVSSAAPDPFDPSQFAANGSIQGTVGVVKEFVACPVRKPHKQEFVRTHPSEAYRLAAHIVVLDEERETYLVTPDMAAQLPGETKLVTLCLTASRQGALFLWPIPAPSLEGRDNSWNASARIAASKAVDHWVRVISNQPQQMYDVFTAPASLGTPAWPDKSMRDILAIAFGESFVIRDAGHPVIRRLLGRA